MGVEEWVSEGVEEWVSEGVGEWGSGGVVSVKIIESTRAAKRRPAKTWRIVIGICLSPR